MKRQKAFPAPAKPELRRPSTPREPHAASAALSGRLFEVMDALPFYAMLVDESHNILMANEAVRGHLGVSPDDIVGRHCPKAIHGVEGPFPGCPLEEAAEKGESVEYELLDKGTGRWLRSAIYPTKGTTSEGKRVFFHMVSDITDRKMAEERLKVSQEQLRSLSSHLESAREEERKRIARSLHDETSQVLSSLMAYLETALYELPARANESRAMLQKSQELAGRILDDLHKLIYGLHPFALHDLGLVPAVASLIDTGLGPTGIKVGFQTTGRIKRLTPRLETVLFRVIQEAIANIARHANASSAEVTIHFAKATARVRVADNGRGFEVGEALGKSRSLRGFGILSMKERVESVGGTLNIRSQPGNGTEVSAEVPLEASRARGPADTSRRHPQPSSDSPDP